MVGCAERLGLNYTKLVINSEIRFSYTEIELCLNYTKLVINLIL